MCSLVDGALPMEAEDETPLDGKSCQKCKQEKPIVTLRKKDVYCKDCFLSNCNHKFRSTLGKNKALKPNDKVLLPFNGSQGCLAILKLVRASLEDEKNPKKVAYFPHVFIIDDPSLDTKSVIALAQKFNFPVFVASLSSYLDDAKNVQFFSAAEYKFDDNQGDILPKVDDPTSRQNLLQSLKRQLILRAAESYECGKVFTGESATSLAISLLAGVAVGRGAHVGNEASFSDIRSDEVKIFRPLSEFSVKEVSFFNQYDSLEVAIDYEESDDENIQKLTQKFVCDLQDGFPSTVPTIFRTGEKLLTASNPNEMNCALCDGIIDNYDQADEGCTALEAAEFSKMISERGESLKLEDFFAKMPMPSDSTVEQGCCSSEGQCGGSSEGSCKTSKPDYHKALCYNCNRSIKDPDLLPREIKEKAFKCLRQQYIKDEIKDFLL